MTVTISTQPVGGLGEIVYTEPTTYISTRCPEWCTKSALHPCENTYTETGVHSRYHVGPVWGIFKAYGEEFSDAPGVVKVSVDMHLPSETVTELDLDALSEIADNARAAAQWLAAQGVLTN